MIKLTVKLTDRVTVEGAGDTAGEALMAVGGFVEGYRKLKELGENPEDYLPQGRANPAGEEFFNLVEKDEKNELKLGQRKDGGIFPHKETVPVWKPNSSGGGGGGSGW